MPYQAEPETPDFNIEKMPFGEVENVSAILTDIFNRNIAGESTEFGRTDFRQYVSPRNILARIEGRNYEVWLGRKGGEIAAVAEIAPPSHITLLFVVQVFRGTGIGRKLFDHLIERICAINENAACIDVTVNSVPASVGFYRHFGFEVNGEEKYREGILNIPLVKRIETE